MEQVKWKKIGGGSFRMANGRLIKPNQVFMATEEEIPQGFRHLILQVSEPLPQPKSKQVQLKLEAVQIQETESQKVEETLADAENIYKMAPRGTGWWNVVNTVSGKVLNEKALRHTDALQLIQSLQ